MALYNLDISTPFTYSPDPANSAEARGSVLNFSRMLRRIAVGEMPGTATVKAATEGVVATGTITLATCLAGTVIDVNGVKFRAIASGTPTVANGEFVISGTDTADAASLAAAINGSTDARIANVLTATSALGVVTLTATRSGLSGNAVSIKTDGVVATGTVTCVFANTDVSDTVTINGTALTAIVQRATGTVAFSTAVAGNTVNVNGLVFTAVAGAATAGQPTFSIDTGDTETATSFAAQINACTDPKISGLITATSVTSTVTLRAVAAGTTANAYVLTRVGAPITVSGSGTLAGGIAVANNQFDLSPGMTDTQLAADLVRCIGASSTALVSGAVTPVNTAGVVTLYAKASGTIGNHITLASSDADGLAVSGARLTGGTELNSGGTQATADITFASVANGDTITIGGVVFTAHTNTEAANQFNIDGTDTADAAVAAKVINASTSALAKDVVATSSGAVLTLTARRGGVAGNAITVATSSGSTLAITGSLARLATGAAPVTVALSGSQLASGTATYTTFSF